MQPFIEIQLIIFQARAKLEAAGRIPKERRKYLHESR